LPCTVIVPLLKATPTLPIVPEEQLRDRLLKTAATDTLEALVQV
jgi:hypothetical protein